MYDLVGTEQHENEIKSQKFRTNTSEIDKEVQKTMDGARKMR